MVLTAINPNLGNSHMSENRDSEGKIRREDRRVWRLMTRERILNGTWEQNRRSSSTRKTVKIGGNFVRYKCDSDDDSDPWHMKYLESLRKEGNFHVCYYGDIRYEGEEQKQEQEKIGVPVKSQKSLENERGAFNKRPNSGVSCVVKDHCNTESVVGSSVDEDWQIFLNSGVKLDDDDWEGIELKGKSSSLRNDSRACDNEEEQQTGEPMKSQQSLETQRGEASCVSHNNSNNEYDDGYQVLANCESAIDGLENVRGGSESKENSSSDRQNAGVSFPTFDTPTRQTDFDEDYLQFMNSGVRLEDIGDSDIAFDAHTMQTDFDEDYLQFLNSGVRMEDIGDSDIEKTYNGEDGSDSSDSDIVLLEPNQISGRTPFVPSKVYDASCFENDTNARDSSHFSACDDSQFRRRLMEDLVRPYDQEEYDKILQEMHHQRQKERHGETRRGTISYRIHGFNKSYLQLYPDLAYAIAEFKEPQKVLFLLRGFIFWLKNMTHEGIFQPWRDESCLKILRTM